MVEVTEAVATLFFATREQESHSGSAESLWQPEVALMPVPGVSGLLLATIARVAPAWSGYLLETLRQAASGRPPSWPAQAMRHPEVTLRDWKGQPKVLQLSYCHFDFVPGQDVRNLVAALGSILRRRRPRGAVAGGPPMRRKSRGAKPTQSPAARVHRVGMIPSVRCTSEFHGRRSPPPGRKHDHTLRR